MFNFLNNHSENINQYKYLLQKTKSFYKNLKSLSTDQLYNQTQKLRKLLDEGNTLEQILPEAFATVKEATIRSIGLEMFDVQILGGIALHYGKIAEMKTGEGKTIVSILPAYLNCLKNSNVHIITVNDYLAKRDAEWVQEVYKLLNIKVGLIQQDMTIQKRKENYRCNITYVTNSELGFDYLRDNMAIDPNNVVQQSFAYAIIDEVDSILIDEARTPLIISGPSTIKSTKYQQGTVLSHQLQSSIHYEIDEKNRNITLTDQGIIFCEHKLKTNNLYDINNPWAQYILNALKAKELFLKNQHYIIRNSEIIIVDEFTGRIMNGRRWSDGLHQAIESKENLPIKNENKTLASITYQNLFLLYQKLSGMTGTAKTEETELDKIYNLPVIIIPTNKPCLRKDLFDLVYKTEFSKWQAVAKECFQMNQKGKPILVGTTNIEKSEMLANMLKAYKITYNLLNAKPENVNREAEIIAQAGRKYAVTISTNMAGRGTDIILGGNAKAMARLIIIQLMKNRWTNIESVTTKLGIVHPDILKILKMYKNKLETQSSTENKLEQNIELSVHNIITENQTNRSKNHPLKSLYLDILKKLINIFDQEKREVLKLGGLHVIGTERHESRRIDNQLKGRAGRQGDPGSSRFFLSLDDHLLRIFGGDKIKSLMKNLDIDDEIPIESTILNKSLDAAQKKIESYFYDTRKQLFEYDAVINTQRQAIYSERKKILETFFIRDCIIEYGRSTIDEILNNSINRDENIQKIYHLFNFPLQLTLKNEPLENSNLTKKFLYEQLQITYDLKEAYLEQLKPGLTRQLEKYYLLEQIDKAWQEHIEKMTLLRESINWRSYGQQDPLIEYKNEAFNLFIDMTAYIRQTVIYLMMRSRLIAQ